MGEPNPNPFNWYYTQDQEIWQPAGSRQNAINCGRDEYEGGAFYICEANLQQLSDGFFDAELVVEKFEEHNEECWGEDGADITLPAAEAVKELEDALAKAFSAWRAKHLPHLKAWAFDEMRNEELIPAVAGGEPAA